MRCVDGLITFAVRGTDASRDGSRPSRSRSSAPVKSEGSTQADWGCVCTGGGGGAARWAREEDRFKMGKLGGTSSILYCSPELGLGRGTGS
jgi:hypothetical protein